MRHERADENPEKTRSGPAESRVHGLEIERFLDHGGCADVWLAKAEVGHVVVKVVRKQVADSELQGLRFYKRLGDDPMMGLVPIHHIGRCESSGRLLYTMPLADSLHGRVFAPEDYEPCTLGRWIQERDGLSWEEAIVVANDVLSSLSRLHSKRLVHRDIKPSNIVRFHDRWCIGDTGLLVNEESLSGSSPAGTPPYMPSGGCVEGRGLDLHAFGKTLYEMLSGDVRKFPERKPEHLQSDNERGYRTIYDVAERACGEGPEDRYESALAILGDLPSKKEKKVEDKGGVDKKGRWVIPIVGLSVAAVLLLVFWMIFPREFEVRTAFLMADEDGNGRAIFGGEEVPNGAKIRLRFQADAKVYVYVWCDSATEGDVRKSYGLFPCEELELENPFAAGEEIHLPGPYEHEEIAWLLDDEPGSQEYHVYVTSRPMESLAVKIAGMTRPEILEDTEIYEAMAIGFGKETRGLAGAVEMEAAGGNRGVIGMGKASLKKGGASQGGDAWERRLKSRDGVVHCVLRFEQVERGLAAAVRELPQEGWR